MAANILDFLMSMQPSAAQSLASSLPFYGLPKKQAGYFRPAQNATNAMLDTDNPLYKKIYGQRKQQGQQNLAESIAELTGQNRKLAAMGRVPLFSAERGGETLFRGINKGYQDIQNNASDETVGILGNAADNYYKQGAIQAQYAANNAGVKGNLLGALTKLFGL